MSIRTTKFTNDNPCRLCLGKSADVDVFNDENMVYNIMTYCQVKVHKNDGLPKLICFNCMVKVDDITQFIKQCYENDSFLRKKFNQNEHNTENKNMDDDSCDYYNEEMFSSKLEQAEDVNLNDDELMNTVQISESGEEYLNYLGIKIIVNRSKVVKKEPGKGRKKTFHLCHICGDKKSRKHPGCYAPKIVIECAICGKEFKSKSLLKCHLTSHSEDRPHKCDICGSRSKTNDALKKHRRMVHHESLVLKHCPVCPKTCKTMTQLKYHLTTHTGQKDYECDYCQLRYSSKSSLRLHIRVHTKEKPFKCKECNKSFALVGSLHEHVRLHTGEKPFECPVCKKGFAQLGNMKSHFRHNHKDTKYEYVTLKRKQIGRMKITKK